MAEDERAPDPVPAPERGRAIGRAAFLGVLAAGMGGIVLGPRISSAIHGALDGAIPSPIASIVPGGGWRIYNVNPPMPVFDPDTYTLSIGGLVRRPRTLGWDEVAALPGVEQTSDFHCVTGWSVDDVRWEGIRSSTIVDLVEPLPSARYVSFVSLEAPYFDQITMAQFRLSDVMLARGMDGHALPREHGAPLRLVIPRMYGYKGVKWVGGIVFQDGPLLGYWEQRGYDVDAWIGSSNDGI